MRLVDQLVDPLAELVERQERLSSRPRDGRPALPWPACRPEPLRTPLSTSTSSYDPNPLCRYAGCRSVASRRRRRPGRSPAAPARSKISPVRRLAETAATRTFCITMTVVAARRGPPVDRRAAMRERVGAEYRRATARQRDELDEGRYSRPIQLHLGHRADVQLADEQLPVPAPRRPPCRPARVHVPRTSASLASARRTWPIFVEEQRPSVSSAPAARAQGSACRRHGHIDLAWRRGSWSCRAARVEQRPASGVPRRRPRPRRSTLAAATIIVADWCPA